MVVRAVPLLGLVVTANMGLADIDLTPIFAGVNTITANGGPGLLWALSGDVVSIISGDEDSTPLGGAGGLAAGVGDGRVVALSHEGIVATSAMLRYDNKQFALNLVDWLDVSQRKSVAITTGHSEWFVGMADGLQSELEARGYTVTRLGGTIDAGDLADVGVVIIGTAWGSFSTTEIDTIEAFVRDGGGLLLTGLLWSWPHAAEAYPMNQIGQRFGLWWLDGGLGDPTDSEPGGSPIFHVFYPEAEGATLAGAMQRIDAIVAAHPADLPAVLEADSALRLAHARAHSTIALGAGCQDGMGLPPDHPQRQQIYDFYRALLAAYPGYFAKTVRYSRTSQSAMAWIRERVYRTQVDALPLTSSRVTEVAQAMGLYGEYLSLWRNFGLILMDNSSFDDSQRAFVAKYLEALPPGLHNLRSISAVDLLGTTSPSINLGGHLGAVNVFGSPIGAYNENSFPDDVPAGLVDGFSIVVAHEVNHVVDVCWIGGHQDRDARRDQLLADAGRDRMNYLRSMLPDGFFERAPQEFFASIANQWFTDSPKTIQLGAVRFAGGRLHPINQAVFFADVYSQGDNLSYWYKTDTSGNIERGPVLLTRNASGHITSMGLVGVEDASYEFDVDAEGNVTAIRPIDPPPTKHLDWEGSSRYASDRVAPTPVCRCRRGCTSCG